MIKKDINGEKPNKLLGAIGNLFYWFTDPPKVFVYSLTFLLGAVVGQYVYC